MPIIYKPYIRHHVEIENKLNMKIIPAFLSGGSPQCIGGYQSRSLTRVTGKICLKEVYVMTYTYRYLSDLVSRWSATFGPSA